MKLTFLGTGAADYPADRSGDDGSPFYMRRYSSLLVDGRLLIDPGPHIYDFEEKLGTPGMFREVTDVLLTHTHRDHFSPLSLERLCAEARDGHEVRFFADRHAFPKLGATLPGNLLTLPVTATSEFDAGEYSVMPCRSNHALYFTGEQTLNYIVRDGKTGHSFFYGADSGWIVYDTWQLIKKAKPEAVIFEATVGDFTPGDDRIFGHTSVPMIGLMMETIIKQQATADGCAFYATHMARTLHGTHEQTAASLAPYGVVPAFDGMTAEV